METSIYILKNWHEALSIAMQFIQVRIQKRVLPVQAFLSLLLYAHRETKRRWYDDPNKTLDEGVYLWIYHVMGSFRCQGRHQTRTAFSNPVPPSCFSL